MPLQEVYLPHLIHLLLHYKKSSLYYVKTLHLILLNPQNEYVMIYVVASIKVRPGKISAFLERFKAIVPNVINENGCIEYIPTIDLDAKLNRQVFDENIVTIIEKWESMEHLQTHLKASHMLSYREEVKDMLENTSLKVLMDV